MITNLFYEKLPQYWGGLFSLAGHHEPVELDYRGYQRRPIWDAKNLEVKFAPIPKDYETKDTVCIGLCESPHVAEKDVMYYYELDL